MKFRDLVISGSVGIGLAVLRLLYVFFPLFNLADVLVFGVAGYGVGRSRPTRRWVSWLLVVLPTLLWIGPVIASLGSEKLREGVGMGHVYGGVLVPVAAAAGLLAAGRRPVPSVTA